MHFTTLYYTTLHCTEIQYSDVQSYVTIVRPRLFPAEKPKWGGEEVEDKYSFLLQEQMSLSSTGAGSGQKELDQETWLCRTHLDDLNDNIWTI